MIFSSKLEVKKACSPFEGGFEVLKAHKLYANTKKCEFGQTQVSYLGHAVSPQGMAVDQAKIQAMIDWPIPIN